MGEKSEFINYIIRSTAAFGIASEHNIEIVVLRLQSIYFQASSYNFENLSLRVNLFIE